MYMGVVGNPVLEKGYDGKVFLKRISENVKLKRKSYRHDFTDNRFINQEIKNGAWKTLVPEGEDDITKIIDTIVVECELDADLLLGEVVLQYKDYNPKTEKDETKTIKTGRLSGKRRKVLTGTTVTTVPVILADLEAAVELAKGTMIVRDVSCDSDFMKQVMPDLGEAIRRAYYWVPKTQPIYLQMDNAGGHGTIAAVTEYTTMMEQEYNISTGKVSRHQYTRPWIMERSPK
jgi:hypothetical protein